MNTIISEKSRQGDYIQTFTGRKFWVFDPRPGDFCIEDIAHALSNLCRFGGHCNHFYSVAQHSMLVCRNSRDLKLGLLHDAPEAYLSDFPSPIKRHSLFENYRTAEQRVWSAMVLQFGLPEDLTDSVKSADLRALATEKEQLLKHEHSPWKELVGVIPYEVDLLPTLTPFQAESKFLDMYELLYC